MRSLLALLPTLLLAALVGLGAAGHAGAQAPDTRSASDAYSPMSQEWTRVQSPHFVVQGDVGEKRLRDVTGRLEQFRDVLNGQFPQAVTALPAPVTVVVFVHLRDYQRFDRTAFQALGPGRGGPVGAFMVVSVEQRPTSDRADWSLYYEYSRLVLSRVTPGLPFWLEVGLMDYFATFRISDDGRTAKVGLPIDEYRLANLRGGRPIPLSELVAADRRTSLTAADKMTGRFSAQCWALVHYLQLGGPARAAQAKSFMQRLEKGEAGVAAFHAAFPDQAKLEQEMLDYVNKPAFSYQEISFASPVGAGGAFGVSRMADAEVAAVRSALKPGTSTTK